MLSTQRWELRDLNHRDSYDVARAVDNMMVEVNDREPTENLSSSPLVDYFMYG